MLPKLKSGGEMETAKQVQMLQMAYAGALADTVLQFSKEGVLERVTERKHREQLATGKQRLAAFGITQPEEVFLKLSEIFGCARWEITDKSADGFVARSGSCTLCAIAKKIGAPNPCNLYCSFHTHTFSKNFSLPRSWRFSPSLAIIFSTTFCVAMPAWSVPGIQRASKPFIRL